MAEVATRKASEEALMSQSLSGGEVSVPELGVEVQSAMADVLPSVDPLDATDFDAVEYLNSKFATERSLSALEGFIGEVTGQIGELDEEISRAVHAQAEAGARASRDIQEAREAMSALQGKIGEIKAKATESEAIVREICRDIKELDCAKKNLVASMTALKRVNMLTTGVAQLRGSATKAEAANLLEAIANILHHFEPYGDVPRISEIKEEVSEIRAKLEAEVLGAFAARADPGEPPEGFGSVVEACAVVDALGARDKEVAAFCARQLEPYDQLFPKGGEFSSLDDVERRFAWVRRTLKSGWGEAYPEEWELEFKVVELFATRTSAMFLEILQSGEPQSVATTLKALQLSLVFEKEVKARYSRTLQLAAVFDGFMDPYVALEKQNLNDVLKMEDEIDDQGALPVFSSSVQMFFFIKTSIKRCTALSSGQTFFKLHKAFCECLSEYAKRLQTKLGGASAVSVACYCLNTAEYCGETVEQLADIVKSKIDAAYTDRVDLEDEQELFHDVIALAVKKLVAALDAGLDPALKSFAGVPWASLDAVDEESAYVGAIAAELKARIPTARSLLSPLYFRNLCDKFVSHWIPKFYRAVRDAKRINETGTHQLLLDLHSIKALFLHLPACAPPDDDSDPPPAPSATYTKYVAKELATVEMVLKLVGTPTEMLVERFKIMWPDGTKDDLLNVCALKGLKKQDQLHLLDTLYGADLAAPPPDGSSKSPPAAAPAKARSNSQEPLMAAFATRAQLESKLESVSAHASLTINKVGSQMRDLINKSNPSRAAASNTATNGATPNPPDGPAS